MPTQIRSIKDIFMPVNSNSVVETYYYLHSYEKTSGHTFVTIPLTSHVGTEVQYTNGNYILILM